MLVDISVVSVMAVYSDLLCVCVVHRAGRYVLHFGSLMMVPA